MHDKPPKQAPIPIVIVDNDRPRISQDVEMEHRKSAESLASQINTETEQDSSQRKSMEVDDHCAREESYFDGFDSFDDESVTTGVHITSHRPSSQPLIKKSVSKTYLTTDDFEYTIDLLEKKIDAIYKLTRYISVKQKEIEKDIKRLVALNELSEDFWNVSNLIHFAVLF